MRSRWGERRSGHALASFLLVGITVVLVAAVRPILTRDPLWFFPATPVPTPAGDRTAAPPPTPTLASTAIPTPRPIPVLSPLPPPPSLDEPAAYLVLQLTASTDRAAISGAFDLLRRRGLRSLVFATPDVHPDFVRLAIADGHQVGLYLELPSSYDSGVVEAKVAAWEVFSRRAIGPAGTPLALLPAEVGSAENLEETLAGLGYHLVVASASAGETAGHLVRVELDRHTAEQLAVVERELAWRGMALVPHWLAAIPAAYPTGEQVATVEQFRAAHIVVIDPGHTRRDVGTGIPTVEGPRQMEWWANMRRALALRERLRADGWEVVLTHDSDALFDNYRDAPDVDLGGATTRADDTQFRSNFVYYLGLRSGRRPVVVSLHVDSSSSPGVRGPIVFYPPDGDDLLEARSYRLALAMEDHVAAFWEDRGVAAPGRGVHSGFADGRKGRAGSGYDILGTRYVEPAPGADTPPGHHYVAVLVEAGTASHVPEGHVMATVEGNRALARVHRDAVNQWMMTELSLVELAQHPRCPDPASLTAEQQEFLAAQEITAGLTAERRVAFAFDAGSGAAPWPAIRAALAEAGVRPTVFLTGTFIRQFPDVVRQMLADGYDLQSHTDTHPDLTELSSAAVQSEFTRVQEALDQAVGAHVPMCLWRPPLGARNAAVRRAAAELGMLEIYWGEGGDTTGWREEATAERVINRVVASLSPGQIYAMHINSWADATALPTVLAEVSARGYTVGDVWSVLTTDQVVPAD